MGRDARLVSWRDRDGRLAAQRQVTRRVMQRDAATPMEIAGTEHALAG